MTATSIFPANMVLRSPLVDIKLTQDYLKIKVLSYQSMFYLDCDLIISDLMKLSSEQHPCQKGPLYSRASANNPPQNFKKYFC